MILGFICYVLNSSVVEYKIDYTNCIRYETLDYCYDVIRKQPSTICQCQVKIKLNSISNNVYLYYGLENYYQNYLSYTRSRDNYQLSGRILVSNEEECTAQYMDDQQRPIVPCGLIANSLFNDTYQLSKIETLDTNEFKLIDIKIDKSNVSFPLWNKYMNPVLPPGCDSLICVFNDTVRPRNWPKSIFEFDTEHPANNGYRNGDFINWMQTAAFPSFKKLYGQIVPEDNSNNIGIENGNYLIQINYCMVFLV